MSGKNYKLFISSDGTNTGTKTEVEYQGDMALDFGKSISRTGYKNGAKSSQGNNGMSGTVEIGDEAPMPAGVVLLWDAHDNGGEAYLWIESAKTGGQKWEGKFKLSIQNKNMPTEGEVAHTVEFSEDGAITRGTVA